MQRLFMTSRCLGLMGGQEVHPQHGQEVEAVFQGPAQNTDQLLNNTPPARVGRHFKLFYLILSKVSRSLSKGSSLQESLYNRRF